MKAGEKKNTGVTITGKVVKKIFAKGSKSEHNAVCIETNEISYRLKRMGGNPFSDPVLEKLVGKEIITTGLIDNYQFIAMEIREIG